VDHVRVLAADAALFAGGAASPRRTVELTEQGQVTDRYTKAIEQPGSGKLDVCMGGIYAPERIAHDWPRDHPAVLEVLAAFIANTPYGQWPPKEPGAETPGQTTRPGVQAAVVLTGRRIRKHGRG